MLTQFFQKWKLTATVSEFSLCRGCIRSLVAQDIHHQSLFIDSLTLRLPGYAQYHFHPSSCEDPVWVTQFFKRVDNVTLRLETHANMDFLISTSAGGCIQRFVYFCFESNLLCTDKDGCIGRFSHSSRVWTVFNLLIRTDYCCRFKSNQNHVLDF